MKKIIMLILLNGLWSIQCWAADWVKLQDSKHALFMLDKQSIASSGKFQKAWVKVDYKAMQQNLEYAEKQYNKAKMLWYFNCKEQKSATAQVYQLLDDEQVYSAALDVKRALFLEPVPETEIDTAMHYVCKATAAREARLAKKKAQQQAREKKLSTEDKSTAKASQPKPVSQPKPKDAKKDTKEAEAKETNNKSQKEKKKDDGKEEVIAWSYKGKDGPEQWGELSPRFATCLTGRNQSPIDIKQAIDATPKALKIFKRFPIKELRNQHGRIEASFKPGNMVVMDKEMYKMQSIQFHMPSEHSFDGKSYAMEAQIVSQGDNGQLAVVSVLFEVGSKNTAITKLFKKVPKADGKVSKVKSKVTLDAILPRQKSYYRYSGSISTPPCTEGVTWAVMQHAMTVSEDQLKALKKAIKHANNRPKQALNGRLVIRR